MILQLLITTVLDIGRRAGNGLSTAFSEFPVPNSSYRHIPPWCDRHCGRDESMVMELLP